MFCKTVLRAFIVSICAAQWLKPVGARDVCIWCDYGLSERFTNCLYSRITNDPIFDVLRRDAVGDMKSSLLAASSIMTKSNDITKMQIMNGALAGELAGMVTSHAVATGQNSEVATSEMMTLIGYCYHLVTGQSETHFVDNIGRAVQDVIRDTREYDYNGPISARNQNLNQPSPNYAADDPYHYSMDSFQQEKQPQLPLSFSSSQVFDKNLIQAPPPNNGFSGQSTFVSPQRTNELIPEAVPRTFINNNYRGKSIYEINSANPGNPLNNFSSQLARAPQDTIPEAMPLAVPPQQNVANIPNQAPSINSGFSGQSNFASLQQSYVPTMPGSLPSREISDKSSFVSSQRINSMIPEAIPSPTLINNDYNGEPFPASKSQFYENNFKVPPLPLNNGISNQFLTGGQEKLPEAKPLVAPPILSSKENFADVPILKTSINNGLSGETTFVSSQQVPEYSAVAPSILSFRFKTAFLPDSKPQTYEKNPANLPFPGNNEFSNQLYNEAQNYPDLPGQQSFPDISVQNPSVYNAQQASLIPSSLPSSEISDQSFVSSQRTNGMIPEPPPFMNNVYNGQTISAPQPQFYEINPTNEIPLLNNGFSDSDNRIKVPVDVNANVPVRHNDYFSMPLNSNPISTINSQNSIQNNNGNAANVPYEPALSNSPVRSSTFINPNIKTPSVAEQPQINQGPSAPILFDADTRNGYIEGRRPQELKSGFDYTSLNSPSIASGFPPGFQKDSMGTFISPSQIMNKNAPNNFQSSQQTSDYSESPTLVKNLFQQRIENDEEEEKDCALKFSKTLFDELMKSNAVLSVFGTNTLKPLAKYAASEALKKAFIDNQLGAYAEEVSIYCSIQFEFLSQGSDAQAHAKMMSKAAMIVLFKNYLLTGNCEARARSIAASISKWSELFSTISGSYYNRNVEDTLKSSPPDVLSNKSSPNAAVSNPGATSTPFSQGDQSVMEDEECDDYQTDSSKQDNQGDTANNDYDDCEDDENSLDSISNTNSAKELPQYSESKNNIQDQEDDCEEDQNSSSSVPNTRNSKGLPQPSELQNNTRDEDEDCEDDEESTSSTSNANIPKKTSKTENNKTKNSRMSPTEWMDHLEKLMKSAKDNVTPKKFNFDNFTFTMSDVSSDIQSKHSDWSEAKVIFRTALETIVALTEVIQDMGMLTL